MKFFLPSILLPFDLVVIAYCNSQFFSKHGSFIHIFIKSQDNALPNFLPINITLIKFRELQNNNKIRDHIMHRNAREDNKPLKVNFDHLNPPFYYFLLLVFSVLVYQTMKIPFRDGTVEISHHHIHYIIFNIWHLVRETHISCQNWIFLLFLYPSTLHFHIENP